MAQVKIDLTGVPETMLWPLWNRAAEHARRDRLIEDPMAAGLVAAIDYDFHRMFGAPNVLHAIRARVGDDLIRTYLRQTPNGTVIALGEGLETQFWRINSPTARWISIDLPEAIEVRKAMLPPDPRLHHIPCSVLDPRWMDLVPPSPAPFISAAGLLMYFSPWEVRGLLGQIANRFPGAEIYFDIIPPWLSDKTLKGYQVTPAYRAPPMPWGISVDAIGGLLSTIPGLEPLSVRTFAEPYPARMKMAGWLSAIPPLRNQLAPGLVHARVASG
ncbi:MAG: class I SAM-dependent methyltransferase [Phenylobacterium sp.]|uniref:class I SAM-dependent methyltransferase n=1 Tax=Phenylobacterium sp. TaxID=1871053 RepID=UPI0025D76864|nr:class I SAM-dependent methyltransferase [Phenylobacterium sp.]MCG9915233.1 class I SAM-dependent methyltransferase [Phenylobacterium sp.]